MAYTPKNERRTWHAPAPRLAAPVHGGVPTPMVAPSTPESRAIDALAEIAGGAELTDRMVHVISRGVTHMRMSDSPLDYTDSYHQVLALAEAHPDNDSLQLNAKVIGYTLAGK